MGNLVYHQVIVGDSFSRRAFHDDRFIALMEALIDAGGIYLEGDEVKVDEKKLRSLVTRTFQAEKIKSLLPYLEFDSSQQRLKFNHDAVKITNPRVLKEYYSVGRGKLLDRKGVVLAESRINPNTKRGHRWYSSGPQHFPIVGYSHVAYGQRGVESILNDHLSGNASKPMVSRIRNFIEPYKLGHDVVLTIDKEVQEKAYNALAPRRGAVVVLEIKTGRILAAASRPSFDPNNSSNAEWLDAAKDKLNRPFSNRAFDALYPPGSTFKVIDVAAALESELVEEKQEIMCRGSHPEYRVRDIRSHGRVDMPKALAVSCNVYFADLGVRLGSTLKKYSEKFGFGRVIDLIPQDDELTYRVEPSLAFAWNRYFSVRGAAGDQEVVKKEVREYREADFRQNPRIVAQSAIGQNLVSVTPLQMAMIAATIANGGVLMNPYLVQEIRGPARNASTGAERGNPLKIFHPQILGQAISEQTAKRITEMMVGVMELGTGANISKLYNRGGNKIMVAGKTGTAEIGDRNKNGVIDADERPHSWFIGFAPAENPEFAIAVIAENAGEGSRVAGPVAAKVLAAALGAREK